MNARNQQAASIALVTACALIVALLGICFFFISKIVGGGRELQGATDSGNLNVAKQAIKRPGVDLTAGERDQFKGVLDDNGLITLRTIDRVIAQALLVGINARDEGTSLAIERARAVRDMAQSGNNSIAQRLADALKNAGNTNAFFHNTAGANNIRMLAIGGPIFTNDAEYGVSFMERNGASNVAINVANLPAGILPPGSLSDKTGPNGYRYLKGYNTVDIGGGLTYQFVPVQPGEAPHLVSEREFFENREPPFGNKIPPNSFRSSARAREAQSLTDVRVKSCALVGALKTTFRTELPLGYIIVENPPGVNFGTNRVPNPDSILSNELLNPGIWVNSSGYFSTDRGVIDAWVDHNRRVQEAQAQNPPGPHPPEPSVNNLFDPQGNPATTAGAHAITGGSTICYDSDVTGSGAIPVCAQKYGDGEGPFTRAYPHPDFLPLTGGDPNDLMAVESVKGKVIRQWKNCGTVTASAPETGLRIFNRSAALPVPSGSRPRISHPGSVADLCSFIGNGAPGVIIPLLKQRIRQIKPEATEEELDALLDSNPLELGETAYIFMKDPYGARRLVLTSSELPPGFIPNTPLDGLPRIVNTRRYPLMFRSVNPHHEVGIHDILFREVDGEFFGQDGVVFTPNSGFNNLLGRVRFSNNAQGAAFMCKPN